MLEPKGTVMSADRDLVRRNIERLRAELPAGVTIEAAAKTRTPAEVLAAVEAGITTIGENYVQEGVEAAAVVGRKCRWHFIGHLQRNKVKKAVEVFDLIETVDSAEVARDIDHRSAGLGKVMPVLIEVNSGREPQKFGVVPEALPDLLRGLAGLANLRVEGLMTMGPESGDPEESRPYFRETKRWFDELGKLDLPGVRMTHLSMGMTGSYRVAVEEGATIVRLGTLIFGPRS
jgi:pyridoxal phosphate enzyme (YggS family)